MEIVSDTPINPGQVYQLITKYTAGSVVFHYAVVRGSSEGKTTSSIEFRAARNNEEVRQELITIASEIRRKWPVEDVLIIRPMGRLKVGDIISLVAVSSPHRGEAFEACHYGVERLKEMTTITKKETFGD